MTLSRIPLSGLALLALLASSLASGALAQGRHDEKPHGLKQIEPRELAEPRVHPGGRHPEQSHKAALNAQKERRASAAKDAPAAPPPRPAGAAVK